MWNDFIKIFYGEEFERDSPKCGDVVVIPKNGIYSLRVYRAIFHNGIWINEESYPIHAGYEVLCTDTFNAEILNSWVESCKNTNGSITYSFYMKIESCDTITNPPDLPYNN